MLIDFVQKRSMGYVLQVWYFRFSLRKSFKKILAYLNLSHFFIFRTFPARNARRLPSTTWRSDAGESILKKYIFFFTH
jgi:hypothetical protein